MRNTGLFLFFLGVFCMHAFMTLNFWLIVIGIVPENTMFGIIPATSLWGSLAWGLGPPVGAVLMVLGGFIYRRAIWEEAT